MEEESTQDEIGITMVDVLQEAEDLEDSVEAVLGAGDDSSCSYEKGYMKRQALYCCLTCCPIDCQILAGICLGCSYHCHEGHELVELYTKRNFRCDCGTSKMKPNSCKLNDTIYEINSENVYNQNFLGKYCTCNRPYPDPEDSTDDQMMQCVICEDWYHGRHLKSEHLPEENNYDEMICHLCSVKLPFLKYYSGLMVITVIKKDAGSDVEIEENEKEVKINTAETGIESMKGCKLLSLKQDVEITNEAMFFKDNWRKQLCCCDECKKMYKELKVGYLLYEEDTVSHYETEGKAKRQRSSSVERELEALSSLDRITRTEVVHEYNNLSTSLREYLKKFAENGKVVSGDDIKEFFSELSARKRQKTGEGMSYFCK